MSEVQNRIDKRGAKRVTYLVQAHFEIQNVRHVVQIRDISKTGVQFFSNTAIQKNIPLTLSWQDPKIGPVVSHVTIVRDIKQPYGSFFQFCYGSKFVSLKDETKQSIDKLIAHINTDEIEANKKTLDVITPELLVELVMQGRLYLQALLKGTATLKAALRFTKDFKDYERQSFEKNEEPYQWIQKLATQIFHCNFLNSTLPLIEKHHPQIKEIHKLVSNKLESITFLIAESRIYMDSLETKKMPDHEKSNFRTLIVESINRLVFNRHQLLETLVKSCESDKSYMERMSDQIKKLMKAGSPSPL